MRVNSVDSSAHRAGAAVRAAWMVMTVLAMSVAAYALIVLVVPRFGAPLVADRRVSMPIFLAAHLAGGCGALALGAWQFNARLRRRALNVHRWLGRAYVVSVLVGGVGGFALSVKSEEGLITHVGFGLLAVLWITTTVMAYLRIRQADQMAHRRWVIRSYALTLAAVTLRLWLPLSLVAGIPSSDAYQVVAWLCWVPNLVIAEWLIIGAAERNMPKELTR